MKFEKEFFLLFLFVHFSFSGFLFTQQHTQDNSRILMFYLAQSPNSTTYALEEVEAF